MSDDHQLGAAAVQFVNLLTPGHFEQAREWVSPSCEYVYCDAVLKGQAIIQSFIDNHERAARELDRIEYLDGTVEKIEGSTVSVLVRDRIWVKTRTYDYQDRLMVTFGPHTGPGSVIRIENRRVEGERDKLLQFFKSCGINWK